MSIRPVAVTAIFGMPTKKFSQKKPIAVLAKTLDSKSYGTLEQYATIKCSICAKDFIFLKKRFLPCPCYMALCCSLQLITYYLTTTSLCRHYHLLDNARYQKCALAMEKAKSLNLNIELCFLPSYPPNLNLIERVWKFMKKKCLYPKYYEKFPAFKEAIAKCLNEAQITYKSDLASLLTLRFQLFEKT